MYSGGGRPNCSRSFPASRTGFWRVYLFDTCVSGAVLEQEVGGCGPVLKMLVEGWKRREIRCSCVYRGGLQEGLGGQAARWKAS